ncbi:MAG: T9SS type A sorting domain-containing protein [Prolixibacteraceae bacterium]|nr:T9SS type A sorting domain-containing protein [Prolixibacteraceae bacterium]
MKTTFYLLLSFLLISTFSWANNTAQIMKAETSPQIDGTKDAIWTTATAVSLGEMTNAGDGDASVEATWSALWDNENLYLLFEVVDDVAINNGAENAIWYMHDCIEVFTDLQNLKSEAKVTNSNGEYQLRFIYGLDDEPIYENPEMTTYESVSELTANGYIIEVKFPWNLITEGTDVAIQEGLKFGVDFKVTDIDAPTEGWWPPHFEFAWNGAQDQAPVNFGEVELISTSAKTAIVYSTFSSPSIDGDIDALWVDVETNEIDVLANAGDGDATVSATWRALWDIENLYMLFEVEDDVAINNGAGNAIWYMHDCIEMLTDMQNLKSEAEVTNSDGEYQLRFIYGLDDEPIYENLEMTTYESVSALSDNGYVIEVKFPWADLIDNTTVNIAEGLQFGADFKVTDIDAPTEGWWPPHYEYVWNNAAGKIPANFGLIALAQSSDIEKPTAPTNLTSSLDEIDLTLNWTASTDNVAVSGYNVKNGSRLMTSVTGSITTAQIKLSYGTTYNISVVAIDAAGNESDHSNIVEIVTEGLAPIPDGTPIANATEAVTIDGKADEASWETASYLIPRVDTWAPSAEVNGHADFSASFKSLWDDEYVYFLFDVTDDKVHQGVGEADNLWVQDCIEVIIAKDETEDYKYRFVHGRDNESVLSGEEIEVPAGFKNVSTKTATGYIIEVAIPWSTIPGIDVVERASTFNVSFSALDIDREDASLWTHISGILGWPYSTVSNVMALGNAEDVMLVDAPAAPAGLTAVANDFKSANLSWTASEGALLYTIVLDGKIAASTGNTSFTLSGLEAETTYNIEVIANNAQKYSAASNKVSVTTKEMPNPTIRKVGIAKINVDPSIDYEVWDTIVAAEVFHPERTFDPVDFSGSWKALWDDNFIYFQVSVHDADIYNSDGDGWKNDNIELHFDMNNESDGTSCETVDENMQIDNFQYRFIAYDKVTQTGSGNAPVWNGVGANYFDLFEDENIVGYLAEIAIPWTSLTTEKSDEITFNPAMNSEFAFEIKITDKDPFVDDAGATVYDDAEANGEMCWNLQDYAISPNRNNSQYGKIFLSTGQVPFVNSVKNVTNYAELNVYPNPAKDVLNIDIPSVAFAEITLSDISGKVILTKTIGQNASVERLSVSELKSGIYLLTVSGPAEISRAKVVVQ